MLKSWMGFYESTLLSYKRNNEHMKLSNCTEPFDRVRLVVVDGRRAPDVIHPSLPFSGCLLAKIAREL